jgi:phosphatidylglycerophosphate synthase
VEHVFDRAARRLVAPLLDRIGATVPVSANTVTIVGFAVGVAACVAYGAGATRVALVGWLLNRALDGLDGAVARRRNASQLNANQLNANQLNAGQLNGVGGFADIVADFTIYAGFVLAVAVHRPEARLAAVAALAAYYVSGASLLAWSALAAAETNRARPDERALHFVGGLAEGTETIVAYVVLCLAPSRAEVTLWVFAAMVTVTAIQRIVGALRSLSSHGATGGPPT